MRFFGDHRNSTLSVVPFLVEDELMRLGAIVEKLENWQNPASSTSQAQQLLKVLGQERGRDAASSSAA